MPRLCATRAIKNAKFIRSVAPDVFSAKKPSHGYASIVPFEILRRFHRLKDEDLHGHPHLLEAARKARAEWAGRGRGGGRNRTALGLFDASPFSGTVYLVNTTFTVGSKTIALSNTDLQTALQYLTSAAPQISRYCSAYGENHLAVSSNVLQLNVNVSSGKYDDDNVRDWVKGLVEQLVISKTEKRPGSVCIVLLSPQGVTNTDGDINQGVGGYHDGVMVPWTAGAALQEEKAPYCFVNVLGSNLSVADKADAYAQSLSHEVAEMTVDPPAQWPTPEVCDPCAGNCGPEWRSLFQIVTADFSRYLGSQTIIPSTPFSFYVAGVAHPDDVDSCPAGEWGCDYGPDDRVGLSELLFYEKSDGYGELYSVDASGQPSLQTSHANFRSSWSLIVPGAFTPKNPGDPLDLLFYDSAAGIGEVYRTGNLGQMNRIATNSGWRPSWSIIVPGHFSDSPNVDLLFYDQSAGHGEFYHTDGHGNLAGQFALYDDWRATWSLIIPGKFSDNAYTDLLFYDPTSGTGEFYATGNGLRPRFAGYTDWRTTWAVILAGNFSDSSYDDLMFYDPTSGTGEFYPTRGGLQSRFAGYTNWRQSWATIVAGRFSSSSYDDLLFYDQSAGVGEIYPTGGGLGGRIAGFTDWRTTWSSITRF